MLQQIVGLFRRKKEYRNPVPTVDIIIEIGNKIVLIAPKDSKLADVTIGQGFDLAKLAGDGKIATGDVKAVPVGKYAKAALEKLGAWQAAEPKFAMAESVRAALAQLAARRRLGDAARRRRRARLGRARARACGHEHERERETASRHGRSLLRFERREAPARR